MSAQAVHLQYNSPMGLYNQETAQEQFQQQVGANAPVPLPAPDKHFDPNKSATLRYLKEGDHSSFGTNFAEKIAAAEAPNVPYSQEPAWARYAREKSERAHSRTPADPSQHRYSNSRSPSQPRREHYDTPWEHQEKNKIYTNAVNPNAHGPAYYQYQHGGHRSRPHSVGSNYPDRGYECGGMDFTKGLPIEKGSSGYYEHHVSRKDEHDRTRPGFEMGGSDFGKGYVAPGPYHGHGPDPPRLRPRYSADPHAACNAFAAPNVDSVDANLLVGDTLSNQKIRHEVRHIDQSEFGTAFAPPGGFKRDHTTIHHAAPPSEPAIYSTNFRESYQNRSASAPRTLKTIYRSSAPAEQQNVWRQRQADTDREVTVERLLTGEATARRQLNPTIPYWSHSALRKHEKWRNRSDPRLDRHEVYTTEPNWSWTVEQRKGAWERKAFDTEAHVNLPASAKVPVPAPQPWQHTAEQKHRVWQNASDYVQQGGTGSQLNQQPRQSQQSYQSYSQQYGQHPQGYSSGTNIMNVANSGFNQNQLDYLSSHQNNFQGGRAYSPKSHNESYSTTTTTMYPGGTGYNQEQRSHFKSSSSTREERTIPVQTGFQESNYRTSSSSKQESRSMPIQPVQNQQYQQSYYKTSSSTQEGGNAPLHPIQTNFQESYQRNQSNNTTQETRNAPHYQGGDLLQTQSGFPKEMLHSPGSYKSFHSSSYRKQETTTSSSGPDRQMNPQVTTTTPVNKNTSYSYSSQSVSQPQQPPLMQQSSTTSHSTREQAIPVGYAPIAPIRSGGGSNYHAESHHSYRKEEQESRPVSQLSQYSQSSYNRKREERTETRTTQPTVAPLSSSSGAMGTGGPQTAYSKIEMNETLPRGLLSNTNTNTQGGYRDQEGHDVYYKRDLQTTADPGKDCALLKEEEKRVVETPLEPGVISRHVTTKYYKKKTVTDTTTTTTPEVAP